MCKEAGTSDQSADLGAHLWAILMSDFLRASPQAKHMITFLVKIFTIWNDEANFHSQKICKLFGWKSLCKRFIICFLIVSKSSGVDQDPTVLGAAQLISELFMFKKKQKQTTTSLEN